jgi:hypothetical protein
MLSYQAPILDRVAGGFDNHSGFFLDERPTKRPNGAVIADTM